jgi:hypothetical protein
MKKASPLPFDYDKELVGARTPCLEGQEELHEGREELGFRYDTSGVNDQIWPKKKEGLWDLSMQLVPFPGHAYETADHGLQLHGQPVRHQTQGDPDKHAYWGDQMRDGLLKGFDRAYEGNRAPLIIGNHFESWNGGTYMRAVEEVIERSAPSPRCAASPSGNSPTGSTPRTRRPWQAAHPEGRRGPEAGLDVVPS